MWGGGVGDCMTWHTGPLVVGTGSEILPKHADTSSHTGSGLPVTHVHLTHSTPPPPPQKKKKHTRTASQQCKCGHCPTVATVRLMEGCNSSASAD